MTDLIRRLHWLLTTDSETLQQTEFLLAQLRTAREQFPGRVPLTAADKALLLKLGKPLGAAVKSLCVIVTPRTFQNWVNAEKSSDEKPTTGTKGGRPPIKHDVRETILRLAKENPGWGYERIRGEIRKLGMHPSRTSIKNILKENGFDSPDRRDGTWAEFLKREAATLCACDYFSAKVWTMLGPIQFFVLFFIHVGSRRVHIAGMSTNPNPAWAAQQARNVAMFFADQPQKPTILLRDHDSNFGKAFDAVFEAEGIQVKKVGPCAPNLNAFAERWVQSVRRECLDNFIILGEAHLRYLLNGYTIHYNEERAHQGVGNVPLTPQPEAPTEGTIDCRERLGGLLNHYFRRAA